MMKALFLKIVSFIVSLAMLTLFAAGGVDHAAFDLKDPENCLMDLTVFSDVHVESNNYPRYKVFATSLKDSLKNQSGSDAYLFLGDSTMNGQNIENMIFHGTVAQILKDQRVITIPGNHDFGNGEGDFKKIRQRWYDYTEAFFGLKLTTPYFYQIVNGCYFIVLANEEQNIDSMHMSEDQYAWLEMMLEDAASSGRPAFVLAHYPAHMDKPIDPDSTYNLISILREYNREHDVFYLGGHMHRPLGHTTFHSWNGFPEVFMPCLTELNAEQNPEVENPTGNGVILELYADRVVCRARNFNTGEWVEYNGGPLECTWTLKNPIAP